MTSTVYASKTLVKTYVENGNNCKIKAYITWDKIHGNRRPDFSITGEIYERGRQVALGCCHEEITKHFPEVAHLIKYHLMFADGPMYYIENSTFFAVQHNEKGVQSAACWPEFRLEDYYAPFPYNQKSKAKYDWQIRYKDVTFANGIAIAQLRVDLFNRLPALMRRFKDEVREFGMPILLESPWVDPEVEIQNV